MSLIYFSGISKYLKVKGLDSELEGEKKNSKFQKICDTKLRTTQREVNITYCPILINFV